MFLILFQALKLVVLVVYCMVPEWLLVELQPAMTEYSVFEDCTSVAIPRVILAQAPVGTVPG